MTSSEILELAHYFASRGVSKIRLTGGEPSLRKDIIDIVSGIQELGVPTAMTSNGVALAPKLEQLVQAGLSSLNLSLDTLDRDRFQILTRRPGAYLDRVLQTLEVASSLELPTKLNCVLLNHTLEELPRLLELCAAHKATLRLIEYMPFLDNGWQRDEVVTMQQVLDQGDFVPLPPSDPNDTTTWFQFQDQTVGFITTVSQPFCSTCNRLRLSADGRLQVCLFGSASGPRLVGLSVEQLDELVQQQVQGKAAQLGGHESVHESERPMTVIGG
jgi:cyclic pyranopterin phosphate synthase